MLGQRLGDVVIHSYEDNGREHSGHRENGAAAHRQNQRFGRVTEMLADTSLFCDVVFKGLEVARDLCLEPGQITAMETGPRDAGGKDKPVPSGKIQVIDVQQAAALAPVMLPQIRLVSADPHPGCDLVVVRNVNDGV